MRLSHPDHPVWNLLKIAIVGLIAITALYVTATTFDETEIKAWAPMLAALAGSEILQHYFRKKQEPEEKKGS